MILVTGGCRSGKSEYAEKLAASMGEKRLYLATGKVFDEETQRRVEKHRKRRGPLWITHEGYDGLELLAYEGYDGILLDSVTSMVTNLLFDIIGPEAEDFSGVDYEEAQKTILKIFEAFIKRARDEALPLVLVTDEIGLGVVPGTPLGRGFRDILGRVNQYLASESEQVYFVISGIPVQIKPGGYSA